MPDYEVIVVGAGLAGSTAAYCLAKEGVKVLLLERGDTAGSKNVTGGRLYAHSLEKIMPGFAGRAPVERRVTRETLSLMTGASSVNLDFQHQDLEAGPGSVSYTVLRAAFDAWLAGEAEAAGCDLVSPAHVDRLFKENGRVQGVVAGDDTLTADVVILADGINSLLARQEGLKQELSPRHAAVGCKEMIELTEEAINDRFNVSSAEGVARLFAGAPSEGLMGGGFLYTNKTTLSLGLVVTLEGLARGRTRLPDMLETFKQHPAIAPLVRGGRLVEYSAHLVPEGGLETVPELTADHLLVVGDAANLCLNLGYTIRGMDYAIASGDLAAQTLIEARRNGADYSKAGLAGYRRRLEQGSVLQDLNTYRNAPAFLERPGFYSTYPGLAERIFTDLYRVTGAPAALARRKVWPRLRKAGVAGILADVLKGVKAV